MGKQAWRIKFEQQVVANGDDGMENVADHLPLLIDVASRMREKGFAQAIGKLVEARSSEKEPEPESQKPESEPILRLASEEPTVIPDCDGLTTFGSTLAKHVFNVRIDPDFQNWGLNVTSEATVAMPVCKHELVRDARTKKMFESLNSNTNALCLTPHQIIEYCKTNFDRLLCDRKVSLFLFKVGYNFYVAHVYVGSDGLNVNVYRLESDCVWYGDCRLHVVVPQLTI